MAQLPLGFTKKAAAARGDPAPRQVLTVAQIQHHLRQQIEAQYRTVSVQGEISNLRVPGSGHAYFSLKDRHACLRCMMWRDELQRVPFRLTPGAEIIATGRVTVYEKSGDLQLVAQTLELAGVGKLYEQYERIKAMLVAEGLTDAALKKPLPRFPRRIGVVTSPSGAALEDVLKTTLRRDARAHVIVSPTRVQGRSVAFEIVSAIRRLDRSGLVDVIILCRGGGSLEDLWAFNEEPVARAIVAARTPIVTGVGHETDTTIADLVADFRASTPTAAAEHCVPVRREIVARLERAEQRLQDNLRGRLTALSRDLYRLSDRLRDPSATINRRAQTIDDLLLSAERAADGHLRSASMKLRALERRLQTAAPAARVDRTKHRLALAEARLDTAMQAQLAPRRQRLADAERRAAPAIQKIVAERRHRLARAAARLDALSPLAVLGRGYAVVRHEDERVVRRAEDVRFGERVTVRVAEGHFVARVEDE